MNEVLKAIINTFTCSAKLFHVTLNWHKMTYAVRFLVTTNRRTDRWFVRSPGRACRGNCLAFDFHRSAGLTLPYWLIVLIFKLDCCIIRFIQADLYEFGARFSV